MKNGVLIPASVTAAMTICPSWCAAQTVVGHGFAMNASRIMSVDEQAPGPYLLFEFRWHSPH